MINQAKAKYEMCIGLKLEKGDLKIIKALRF